MKKAYIRGGYLHTALTYGILILAAVVVCFPVLFSLSLSFLNIEDILRGNYIPRFLNFENYINAFRTQPLFHYMLNSAISGVLSTALQIIFALLASYAIVFIPFRGKKIIFIVLMATMMIPGEVLVISNFQTIRSAGLLDTFAGLILPGVASTFSIFLFRQNMLQIPKEMKEASMIAGMSDFRFFLKVVAPMVKNAIVTLVIYLFLVNWNSYMWPLLSTTDDTVRTVQIGLRQLKNAEAVSDYGMMAAGAIVTSLPTLLLIFFGQKRLQEGMSKGALK